MNCNLAALNSMQHPALPQFISTIPKIGILTWVGGANVIPFIAA